MKVIPLIPNPNQSIQILLGEQEISMRIYQRNTSLYIDIKKGLDIVCLGQKCIFGKSLITFTQDILRGTLHFIDIKGTNPPEFSQISTRYFLVYLEENESLPEMLKW